MNVKILTMGVPVFVNVPMAKLTECSLAFTKETFFVVEDAEAFDGGGSLLASVNCLKKDNNVTLSPM